MLERVVKRGEGCGGAIEVGVAAAEILTPSKGGEHHWRGDIVLLGK